MLNKIYKITNKIDGKIYIGKTAKEIEKRFKEHCNDYTKREEEKRPLYNAMKKYGIENFYIELVEDNISDEEINEKEIYYIKYYNSYVGFENSNGYNATLGGDGKKYKDYDINEMIRLYKEENYSCVKIAKEVKLDPTYVSDLLKANDVKIKTSKEKFSKPVYQLDKETGEIIAKYNSLKEAEEVLTGKYNNNISKMLSGKQKIALGYKWRYVNQEDNI